MGREKHNPPVRKCWDSSETCWVSWAAGVEEIQAANLILLERNLADREQEGCSVQKSCQANEMKNGATWAKKETQKGGV